VVRQFLHQALAAYAPEPDHVYLLGHSQGATAAGTLGLLEPLPLAGIVMVSGYLWPPILTLLADQAHLAGRAFLVGHGLHDTATPIELGRATRDLLATLPVDLTYQEYEMGHGMSAICRTDVVAWLQERWAPPKVRS
jgi:phospholipase/carboxylesterase